MPWRLRTTILKRILDESLWTTADDCPYPLMGYNLVSIKKAKIGWWIDYDSRWITYDFSDFELLHR